MQVGQQVGCPTSDTKALANCLRASDPKAVTLAYKQQLVNLASKSRSPRWVLRTQEAPCAFEGALAWLPGVVKQCLGPSRGTTMTDFTVTLPQAGARCAE